MLSKRYVFGRKCPQHMQLLSSQVPSSLLRSLGHYCYDDPKAATLTAVLKAQPLAVVHWWAQPLPGLSLTLAAPQAPVTFGQQGLGPNLKGEFHAGLTHLTAPEQKALPGADATGAACADIEVPEPVSAVTTMGRLAELAAE